MGKKSSKETTTTTSAPPTWATPIIKDGANAVMNTYNQNQGNLSAISGQVKSMLPQLGAMAMDTSKLQGGLTYANDVMGGKYLNSNPYVNKMAQQAGQDALNSVNSTFSLAGRTGGGNHAERAAQGVAEANNALRCNAYSQERQLQNQAASLIPAYQQAQFAGVTPYLGAAQLAGQMPYYGSQSLGTVGSLLGGYGTSSSTGTKPGGWGTDILNAGMAALPFALSEREAKADIEELGEWDERGDGLKKYRFRYKFDPSRTMNVGVMADEVEKLRPWALGARLANGWRTVNYAALGSVV